MIGPEESKRGNGHQNNPLWLQKGKRMAKGVLRSIEMFEDVEDEDEVIFFAGPEITIEWS